MTARCRCCRRTLPAVDCPDRCYTCAARCPGKWDPCEVRAELKPPP